MCHELTCTYYNYNYKKPQLRLQSKRDARRIAAAWWSTDLSTGWRAGGKWGPGECEQGPSMFLFLFLFLPHVGVFMRFICLLISSSAWIGAVTSSSP
jgi:hypothetical protein